MNVEARRAADEIAAAFRGVPRGAITLHEAEMIDSYGTAGERAKARESDTDARWEDIPDSHVEACANALPHLDPVSWAYYVPRFMTWALHHAETRRGGRAVDHVVYSLLLRDDKTLNDHLRARFERLSLAQVQAVAAFLRYIAGDEHRGDALAASEALRLYWDRAR